MDKKNTKALLYKIAFRFIDDWGTCDTCGGSIHIESDFQPFRKSNNTVGIDCARCYEKETK